MKKRWLALQIGLALCLALAPRSAAAERPAPAPLLRPVGSLLEEASDPVDEATLQALPEPDYAGATEALRQGIVALDESIRLDQYHIPDTAAAVTQLMCSVFYRYGELFALDSDPGRTWSYSSRGGVLYEILPPYRLDMDAESYARARDFYDKALQAIADQIPEGFSDAEKVLFVHDYLAANYAYDYSFTIYDAYSFLREGKGVCQAYALTFSALMDRLGIPVSYVESTLLNHVWNVVELDGTWYHIDVTWDDPTTPTTPDDEGNQRYTDVAGAASHVYFLLSDGTNEALRRAYAEEYGLEYVNDQLCGQEGMTCPDDAYENGPWAQADSPVLYVPETARWYYLSTGLSDGGLYCWTGDVREAPVQIGDYSTTYYGGATPLAEYRGCLFFADPGQVNRYELSTGTMDSLCAAGDEMYSYSGFHLENGRLSVKDRVTGELVPFEGQLLPWREVDGGLFSYYYDFGQVDVCLGEDAGNKRFFLAWYDGATGQMTGLDQITADGSFGRGVTDRDLECTMFVLSGDDALAPTRPKLSLKPQLELDK